jgi:hypothetical protein
LKKPVLDPAAAVAAVGVLIAPQAAHRIATSIIPLNLCTIEPLNQFLGFPVQEL